MIPELQDVIHLVEGSFEKSCEKFKGHDKSIEDFDDLKSCALEVKEHVK